MTEKPWNDYELDVHLIVAFLEYIKNMKIGTHEWKIFTFLRKWNAKGWRPTSADIAYKLEIPEPSCRRTVFKMYDNCILDREKQKHEVWDRTVNCYYLRFNLEEIHSHMNDLQFARALITNETKAYTVDMFDQLLEDVIEKVEDEESSNEMQKLAALFG